MGDHAVLPERENRVFPRGKVRSWVSDTVDLDCDGAAHSSVELILATRMTRSFLLILWRKLDNLSKILCNEGFYESVLEDWNVEERAQSESTQASRCVCV